MTTVAGWSAARTIPHSLGLERWPSGALRRAILRWRGPRGLLGGTRYPEETALRPSTARVVIAFVAALLLLGFARPATAAPEGTMTWGVHITLASRWLDPAETEGIITPFMVLYALHD